MHPNYDSAVSPQLHLTGLVVRFHARHRENDDQKFADVAFASRHSASKKEDLGYVDVWMDVRLNKLTAYAAILLCETRFQDDEPSNHTFLLLREVALPTECQESGDLSEITNIPEIAHCKKYERVGLLTVFHHSSGKQLEELDWHTQAQWKDIIIC